MWPDGYIIIQSLAIYTNDNLPNTIKMPKWVQKFAIQKIAQSLPKWRNFAKSGHTVNYPQSLDVY